MMRAKERASGLFPELCTAAARWRPAGARCCVARRGEDTTRGKSGSEGLGATCGEAQKQEVAGDGPERRAALRCAGDRGNKEAGWRKKVD